ESYANLYGKLLLVDAFAALTRAPGWGNVVWNSIGPYAPPLPPPAGIVVAAKDDKGGARVAEVVDKTAAARAGIKKGDRIVAVNGTDIADPKAFLALTQKVKPGALVDLGVESDGKRQTVSLPLGRDYLALATRDPFIGYKPPPKPTVKDKDKVDKDK